ncbi:thiol peroxidase [Gramella sp. KN1008]|uniref:thiol peroxidase n=1 Tax=Gramella sp. KN1008 TaxID=2529298 RepID=UPI0010404EE3|nr:thiol peroxidase [Gramella sp. KN1008]TBW28545.1 thiol peroxidase [Gramella sp. KN1008]
MAIIEFGGEKVTTYGSLPSLDEKAPHFELINQELSIVNLEDFKGKRLIMNIFPSIDTGVCAKSVRNFSNKAAELENVSVLCISRDLPFAQQRFTKSENLENIVNLSDFRERNFGKDYGVEMIDGPWEGLLSRAVLVLNENGHVIYSEQVSNIDNEPDYLAALKTLL